MGLSKKHLFIPLAATLGIGAGFITNVAADSGARTSPSGAPSVPLVSHLKGGAEEVPVGGDPDGYGFALINVSPETNEVCAEITTSNIGEWTLGHIHEAGVGAAGDVVVDFGVPATGTGPELTECVVVEPTEDFDVQDLVDSPADYYVNIHTAEFPAGAVRGQLAARSSETQFNPVPVRVYDSRTLDDGKFAIDETRMVDLELPVGVRAGIVTVTVTETEIGGFLTLYAGGADLPETSTINWTQDDASVATTTFAAVDEDGMISITAGQNATHVIIDVIGFVI